MGDQWPPPAGVDVEWRDFTPRASRDAVRAREVTLWGKQVWVNADGDVWCPSCLAFRTVTELAKVGNGCPVGIVWPSGTIAPFEPGDDGPVPVRRDQFLDALWRRW